MYVYVVEYSLFEMLPVVISLLSFGGISLYHLLLL